MALPCEIAFKLHNVSKDFEALKRVREEYGAKLKAIGFGLGGE